MPVVSVANSKGGSGKSTAALILAGELAESADVVLIDADPRRPIAAWSCLDPVRLPERLEVIRSEGERSILDEIQGAAERVPFVIVDLEGSASRLASYAIGQSDLVLVPAQEQHQDAAAALETLREVSRDSQAVRRDIPAVVVLSRTKAAVKSRTNKHISSELRRTSARVLDIEIVERDAFAAMWSCGATVRGLRPEEVRTVGPAIDNAAAFTAEVVELLREVAGQGRVSA